MEKIKADNTKLILLSIFSFGILYNVSPLAVPSVTTGRLSLIFLMIWSVFYGRYFFKLLNTKTLVLFLPFPYVLVQYFLIGDYGQTASFVNLFLYAYVGAALVVTIATDRLMVLKALLFAIFAQAIIIIISFFSTSYREWYDTFFAMGANFDSLDLYHAPGFSGYAGAALSLTQSMGVLIGFSLISRNDRYNNQERSAWGNFLIYLLFFVCAISCMLVGRTGILVSLIFVVVFIFNVKLSIYFSYIGWSLLFGFLILLIPFSDYLSSDFSGDFYKEWAFGFLTLNDHTVQAIQEMPIPPLDSYTFFGTGLKSLNDGVNPSGNDSGFVQAYYSMGLPMAIIFYVLYFLVLFHILRWLRLYVRIVLTIVFFSLEYKEPFLFKYALFFVLMCAYFSCVSIESRRWVA